MIEVLEYSTYYSLFPHRNQMVAKAPSQWFLIYPHWDPWLYYSASAPFSPISTVKNQDYQTLCAPRL